MTPARSVDQAISEARRGATEAVDGAADQASDAADAGADAIGAAAARTDTAVRRGLRSARATAHDASEDTAGFVRARPLQALLVAAAAGAAVVTLLVGVLGRPRKGG